jgi:GGDEF domain-containing protein
MDEALRQQAEAGTAPVEAYAGSERRADAADVARMAELRSKGLSNLTPDETGEYAKLLESDRLAAKVGGRRISGLLSREAYEERAGASQQLPHVGYFDLDMFKDINDQFGSHAGDDVIRATGEAAAKIFGEGNAFKGSERAGDEFMVQGKSPEEIQAGIEALRQHLANHKIQAYDETGNLIHERQGVDFSHGIGQTAREAEAAAKLEKQRRAAIGLRRNRGTVAEEPAGERGPSESRPATGTGAAGKGTELKAASELATHLEALRESNGTDEKAHAAARRVLLSAADQGHDVGSIERAAVERAGADTGPLLAAVKASEKPLVDAAGLDPATHEAVDAAQRILARGDMTLKDETTNQVHSMREELVRAVQDAKNAREDGILHQVAAACGAR